jgi:hypothetical protein
MADQDGGAIQQGGSPSLLAQQPLSLGTPPKPGKDWDTIFDARERRLNRLRNWRLSWWSTWGTIAEYLLPRRYHFLVVANRYAKGSDLNTTIVDGTPTLAMQTCSAGLWSGLTSPTRPWVELGVGSNEDDADPAGQAWAQAALSAATYVWAQSNLYTAMAQFFQDVVTFGTSVILIYEDDDQVIRCYVPAAGEYFLGVDGRLGVSTFYREYTATVEAIVDQFGLVNCPTEVRQLWRDGSLDTEFVVAHSIEPNVPIQKGDSEIRVVPKSFPYAEVYWLRGRSTERELSRRGFHAKPFGVGRWSTVSNDPYGRGPGHDALGDIKQLQLETRRKAEYLDKLLQPPMGAHPSLKNQPSDIRPGGITYFASDQAQKGFFPLYQVEPTAYGAVTEDIQQVQQRIERTFFVDLFMAITNMEGVQPRNEMELTKRDLERLQALGPFITLFESEVAQPIVLRTIDIMERRGLLPPRPPGIQGDNLRVKVNSMLKVAQSAAVNASIASVVSQAISMSQAAKESGAPDPLDRLDMDKALEAMARNAAEFPMAVLRPDAVVQQMRNQKTTAAQQATAAQIAPSAVTAAQQLSKTDPNAGALGALLGNAA